MTDDEALVRAQWRGAWNDPRRAGAWIASRGEAGMSEQERLERAAVQLAWEMSTRANQLRWVVPISIWKSMAERRRDRYRRMAIAILAAADGRSVDAP